MGAVRVRSVIVPAFSPAQTRTQAPTEGLASYRDRRRRGRKGERSASTDPVADRVQLPEIPDAARNATARHRRHAAIGPIPTLRGTTSSPLRSSAVDDLEFHIDHAALRGINFCATNRRCHRNKVSGETMVSSSSKAFRSTALAFRVRRARPASVKRKRRLRSRSLSNRFSA